MEPLLNILFNTYPLYHDRPSRRAVQICLITIFSSPLGLDNLPAFVNTLKVEASKPGIAPTNALVLVEWCGLLLSQLSETVELWNRCGIDVITGLAQALELCLGSAVRDSVKHSALVVTRRGLRKVFYSETIAEEAITSVVTSLTTKGTSNAKNAVLLGVVAGVCARRPNPKHVLEGLKKDYYTFYLRELIGSRALVPRHLAEGLHDFFVSFTSCEDFNSQIVPALEKALLRAPEIILNDLIGPLIRSINKDIDISDMLLRDLLKPLLANIKSTNAIIRTGATNAFGVLASHCYNQVQLERVAEDILLPLKQSKITVVEQRHLHAQMLSLIPCSEILSQRIPKDLAEVTAKEPNETALRAEAAALVKHLTFGLSRGLAADKTVLDVFHKGLSDKKALVRRLWAMSIGDLLWGLTDDQSRAACVGTFVEATIGDLLVVYNEVVENPLPAAQTGLVAAAYVLVALSGSRLQSTYNEKLTTTLKKANIVQKALTTEPKPSFLLNHKIYSKLSLDEEFLWALRALATVSRHLASGDATSPTGDAWAQAFLYMITSVTAPVSIRRSASRLLSEVYIANPATISRIMVEGLWRWGRRVETADRDSAAMTARTGNSRLHEAIRSICLPPTVLDDLGAKIEPAILKDQLVEMLVLCRPEILPRIQWIEMTLRAGIDPGTLVQDRSARCLEVITGFTTVCKIIRVLSGTFI